MNLHTGAVTVLRSPQMNAEVTVLFLQKVLMTYPDRPILLLWERAPWHRGTPLQAFLAAHPRLEVLCLPTAAPDLNPQEHVWKTVRDQVSHNHRETRLESLADPFQQHLETHRFPCSLLELHDYNNICMMFK